MTRQITQLMVPSLLLVGIAAAQQCHTLTGSSVSDGPVSAQANFTTADDGTVTVTVQNLLADPKSAGELLNGVGFTLSTGQTSGTLGLNAADIIRIGSGGVVTDLGLSVTGWGLEDNVFGGLMLCVLCHDAGGVGPSHLLIGPPATDGNYDSANRSIAGNRPHNPFTSGTATFTINVPGVTSATTITGATFFFSTQEGVSVAGSCTSGMPQ